MAETFQLEIVTPDRLLVSEPASEAQIPGSNGYLGILPGHAPLITELSVGEITYKSGGKTERIAVAWGFAEVLPDKVTVIADTAELASEIDVQRAQESKSERRSVCGRQPRKPISNALRLPCSAPKIALKPRISMGMSRILFLN